MYKKITHNIIEEHFGYPMPEEKSTISDNKNKIPTTTIFNPVSFKKGIESFLTSYAERLVGMTDQVTGTEEDLIKEFELIFANVDDLGNATKNFYSSDLGERINMNLRALALLTFVAVNNVKLGRDAAPNFNRMNTNASDFAFVLSTFNSLWENFTVRTVLQKIVTGLQAKIKARKEKNSSAEQTANASILEQFKVFSDAVANGIVKKFPERFTAIATATDRNIM
jgi:hypothetical protein